MTNKRQFAVLYLCFYTWWNWPATAVFIPQQQHRPIRSSFDSTAMLKPKAQPFSPSSPSFSQSNLHIAAAGRGSKVVHLHRRPTQIYYKDVANGFPEVGGKFTAAEHLSNVSGMQLCMSRVAIEEVYATSDTVSDLDILPHVDVFFYCAQGSQWCCGIDCCQMNWTFLLALACVCLVASVFFVHACVRNFVDRLMLRRALKRLHLVGRRRRRVLARGNAQRRKSAVIDSPPCGIQTLTPEVMDIGTRQKKRGDLKNGDTKKRTSNVERQSPGYFSAIEMPSSQPQQPYPIIVVTIEESCCSDQ